MLFKVSSSFDKYLPKNRVGSLTANSQFTAVLKNSSCRILFSLFINFAACKTSSKIGDIERMNSNVPHIRNIPEPPMPNYNHWITSNPNILFGKPAIKDTRIAVEQILDELSGGTTIDELLEAYPRSHPGRNLCRARLRRRYHPRRCSVAVNTSIQPLSMNGWPFLAYRSEGAICSVSNRSNQAFRCGPCSKGSSNRRPWK